MPVIGRLDRQVNDVLIEPVGRRRTPDDGDDAAPAPSDDPARTHSSGRDATAEDTRPRAGRTDDSPARPYATDAGAQGREADARAREDHAREDEELPVWLL